MSMRIAPILIAAAAAGFQLASGWVSLPSSSWAREKATQGTRADAETHVGKGYELVKDERYREAAAEFRAALAIDPHLVRAHYQLAVCLFALNDLKEAREEFERLQRETANDPSVRYYLGRLDLLEGNDDAAIREFASLMHDLPFADTAYYLGSAYLKKGNLTEAEKWLVQAAQAVPRDFRVPDHLARVYQKEGKKVDAEKQFALSAQLRDSYNQASRDSVACSRELETHPLAEARAACQKLYDRSDPDKLTTLGMLYGQHGYYEEALAPLQEAARLDPGSSEIQHNLGLTYFRLRRFREATGPLETAVAARPDFFGSNALLGATLYALREDAPSYQALNHAHQLNPQDVDTANLLFKVAVILAQKEFEQKKYEPSLAYLKTASELRPSDAEVRQKLVEVHRLLGRPNTPHSSTPEGPDRADP
jgi:tetratricopeptide (TPR) repeat protein